MIDKIVETNKYTEYDVSVFYYTEAEYSIIYCPSLEIMLHSLDRSKLDKLFEASLHNFYEICDREGTDSVLFNLGWSKLKDTGKLVEPPESHELPAEEVTVRKIHLDFKQAA